jgi:DNA-binding transcriptional regulator YiaG
LPQSITAWLTRIFERGPNAMPMTPKDVTRTREQLGLSKEHLAAALGVTVRTVYYWEHGERPVTRVVELALEALRYRQRRQRVNRSGGRTG